MDLISFKRHRFPPDVIRYAVWLYFRLTLSIREVEGLLAQRGIDVSREAVRCWVINFAPLMAANLRHGRSPPTGRWHLDEMVVGSVAPAYIFGAPSMMKARSWTCPFGGVAIRRRH